MLRLLLALVIIVIAASGAQADDLRPGYLEIREYTAPTQARHAYAVTWKAPIKPGLATRVTPTFPKDCVSHGTPEQSIQAAALLARWSINCATSLTGRTISLTGIGDTAGDALMRFQSYDGATQAARLTPANSTAKIAARPDRWQVARTYFITGVEHILMGYDHLLFVLCLVLLLNGAWQVAATVTAFTIAHSLTLIATTLGLISLPRAPVEAVIALSIVFLAVEIVKRKPGTLRLSERIPWVVAFLFGLLHGFGFAGALAEIGLPQGEVPTALLTFNLGVEAGQLVIVGVAMAAFWLLGKTKLEWLKPVQTISAYAIGAVASMWLVERVIGL